MNITYIDPLSRGLQRMKKALFQPFDITRWLAVGFTAFLAGLTDWDGGGGGGGGSRGKGHHGLGDITGFPYVAWDWLMDHPGWFLLIMSGIFFIFALTILLTWLSSRGKFMFLDNVVHDRARVVKPWYEFRSLANSLFIWRFCYGLICFVLFISFFVFCFFIIYNIQQSGPPRLLMIFPIAGLFLVFLFMVIAAAYISLFLTDFVVPIMYKNNMTIIPAWGRFLSLFTRHSPCFLLYGVLVLALYIVVFLCILVAGLLTCCIGFLVLIIPYIGSVILLPVSYTFRAFSLEFLAQFGPELTLFPQSESLASGDPSS